MRLHCTAGHLHFADKDELFLEACSRRFRELDDWVERASQRSDDPLESLRLRGDAYVRSGLEHPEVYRFLMMGRREGNINEPGMEAGHDAFMHLVEAVDRCVSAGALAEDRPRPHGRNLPTRARQTGVDSEARRDKASHRDTDGAGSSDPAGSRTNAGADLRDWL